MHIRFTVSGGYGGLFAERPLAYETDTESLPEREQQELDALVSSSHLTQPQPQGATPPPHPAADVFQYTLVITKKDGHTVRYAFDDTSAPQEARPLLGFLTIKAMNHPHPT